MAYKKVEQYDDKTTDALTKKYQECLGLLGRGCRPGRLG